jgi:hypothetical protein
LWIRGREKGGWSETLEMGLWISLGGEVAGKIVIKRSLSPVCSGWTAAMASHEYAWAWSN